MTQDEKQVFISYARADEPYITSLTQALDEYGVRYWLDRHEIDWGDDFVSRINDGLAACRFVLVCLSRNTLGRPWPTAELSAAFAHQAINETSRVLPLILDSREAVLQKHPLLLARSFREFDMGADALARELAAMSDVGVPDKEAVRLTFQSIHTGQEVKLSVPRAASLAFLRTKALAALGLREEADAGAFERLRVRWVIVAAAADQAWDELTRDEQRSLVALLDSKHGALKIKDDRTSLSTLPVSAATVLHLYAVEDERFRGPVYSALTQEDIEEQAKRSKQEAKSILTDWEPERVRNAISKTLDQLDQHSDFIQTHGRASRVVACVSCRKFEGAVLHEWINSSSYRQPASRPLCDHRVESARCKDPRVQNDASAWWYQKPSWFTKHRNTPFCPYFQNVEG